MRTPRPVVQRSRGIGTLIGNGWLHESPANVIPRGWDLRSKSAMRKCMFMPSPFAASPTEVSPAKPFLAPKPKPKAPPVVDMTPPRKIDTSRKARVLPAYVPQTPQPAHRPHQARPHVMRAAWYEDPVALGSLLILLPPIGLAALWSSKRYGTDARWALTIMTGLTMSLTAAVFVAAVFLRR